MIYFGTNWWRASYGRWHVVVVYVQANFWRNRGHAWTTWNNQTVAPANKDTEIWSLQQKDKAKAMKKRKGNPTDVKKNKKIVSIA